jgi:CRP-like cAMP-binding protein
VSSTRCDSDQSDCLSGVDEPIIVEGQPANMVTLLLDGTVAVSVGEEGVAVQQGGSWLGAIEYLGRADDESFGATAVATATVKAIQWPVDALRGCCSRNPALSLPLSSGARTAHTMPTYVTRPFRLGCTYTTRVLVETVSGTH